MYVFGSVLVPCLSCCYLSGVKTAAESAVHASLVHISGGDQGAEESGCRSEWYRHQLFLTHILYMCCLCCPKHVSKLISTKLTHWTWWYMYIQDCTIATFGISHVLMYVWRLRMYLYCHYLVGTTTSVLMYPPCHCSDYMELGWAGAVQLNWYTSPCTQLSHFMQPSLRDLPASYVCSVQACSEITYRITYMHRHLISCIRYFRIASYYGSELVPGYIRTCKSMIRRVYTSIIYVIYWQGTVISKLHTHL